MALDRWLKMTYLVGVLAGSMVRAGYRLRTRGNRIAKDRATIQDKLVLALPSVGMVAMPAVYLSSNRLGFADYRLPSRVKAGAGLVGGAVFGAGLWLLWRSHADLGRNWSPTLEIREDHTLVIDGVYRRIRHPMYAAHWLWAIGQALLLQNWAAGPATLMTYLPMYLARVSQEERMMLESFGEEYMAYMDQTGRVLPRIG